MLKINDLSSLVLLLHRCTLYICVLHTFSWCLIFKKQLLCLQPTSWIYIHTYLLTYVVGACGVNDLSIANRCKTEQEEQVINNSLVDRTTTTSQFFSYLISKWANWFREQTMRITVTQLYLYILLLMDPYPSNFPPHAYVLHIK